MIKYGFTNRKDGNMRNNVTVDEYIRRKDPRLRTIVRPHQIHSDRIVTISREQYVEKFMKIESCDAVITDLPHTALTVVTADCVPVVFSDEVTGQIAVSHQGWQGLLASLPMKVVTEMSRYGSDSQNIRCIIGPSIADCCYSIPSERAELFRREYPNTQALTQRARVTYLNLLKLTYEQLVEVGVPAGNITYTLACTSCQEDMYFSYRKSDVKTDFPEQMSYIVKL